MYTNFYSKQGMMTMYLSRDLLSLDMGEKVPTIAHCTEKFNVSRGVVQQAISFLQNEGAIEIYKGGKNGSILQSKDVDKLQVFTGWDTITASMPVPFSTQFISLATGIHQEMKNVPLPFSFAYMSGADNRQKNLEKMMFDFIVVSELSAKLIIEKNNQLEIAKVLDNCFYSENHFLYFTNGKSPTIKDGLRVGIDHTCLDQVYLTQKLFEGFDITYVELPYITLATSKDTSDVDCFVARYDGKVEYLKSKSKLEIPKEFLVGLNPNVPVLMTNKDNYGMKKLIEKYFSSKNCALTQISVLSGDTPIQFL